MLKDWRVVLFAIFAVHEYCERLGVLRDFLLDGPSARDSPAYEPKPTELFRSIFPSIWEWVQKACGGALLRICDRQNFDPVMIRHYFDADVWHTCKHVYRVYTESRAFQSWRSEWTPLDIADRNTV